MFEIQEDYVSKTLIVALTIIASMENVSKLVKTVMTVCMKIIVCTIFVFPEQFSSKGLVAPIDPIHF